MRIKTNHVYLLQNIETLEFLTGIYNDDDRSIPVLFGAREFSYDEACKYLKENATVLEDYVIVARCVTTKVYTIDSDNPAKLKIRFEQDEVLSRLQDLNAILNNTKPEDISSEQWSLLTVQASIMRSYISVLDQQLTLL